MTADPPPTPGAPLRPGMLVAGRYELVERLGGGGMGEVFRARDLHLGREVAVKHLLPQLTDRADLVLRAEREGRILASLKHPAIIDVYDMLESPDGGRFLILELVPGRSFADELREHGRLPWRRCVDVGSRVCGALAAAHAASVVHRDIKPANILVGGSGEVFVADFGIARLETATAATAEGAMIGTPDYWAPEQATRGEVTAASDIYSLCCVLFEAACGRPPFVADEDASPAAVFVMHVVQPVPDPHDIAPDLPEEARAILMRGMAKEPGDRFPSARALAEALEASRDATPVRLAAASTTIVPPSPAPDPGAAPVPTGVGRRTRGHRRRRATTIVGGLAAALLVGIALLGMVRGGDDPRPAPAGVTTTAGAAAEPPRLVVRSASGPEREEWRGLLSDDAYWYSFVPRRDPEGALGAGRRVAAGQVFGRESAEDGAEVGGTWGQALYRDADGRRVVLLMRRAEDRWIPWDWWTPRVPLLECERTPAWLRTVLTGGAPSLVRWACRPE